MTRPHIAFLLLGLSLASGCVSAAKRVDQGMRLEQSGRPADAARRYADALRRDPSLTEARVRLQESGDRAVAELLAEAGAADPAASADLYLEVDELRRVASVVGVELAVPDRYPELRRAALDRAIMDVLVLSRDPDAGGGYESVGARLARAANRWEATDMQRAQINRARFDVYLRWADEALRTERYRAAHQRAQMAIDAVGAGSAEAPRAMDIQAEALRRGTIRVAVLPAGVVSDVRGDLPGDFLAMLNDDLTGERWREETLFIAVANPEEVAREARRRGYLRQLPTRTEARSLAAEIGADVAAMLVIDSVEVGDVEVEQSRVAARTTAGVDTAYTLRTGRRQVRIRLAYHLLDVDGYQQPERFTVWTEGSVRFRRATYRGDLSQLALTNRTDRELFTSSEPRLGHEQVREMAERLGERLERELISTLQRRIP